MNYDELNGYIKHYVEKDKTQSAIMLTGGWGTGKSYYIHNFLEPFLKEPENGKHRCAIVSLYGLKNTSEISKRIYFELRTIGRAPKKSEVLSTGKAAATILAKTVLNGMTNMIGFDIGNISDETLDEVYSSINLSNALIVFEDLERSNIDQIEILGYVNSLVEQDGAKVLLVANEDEIIKTSGYVNSKEKTISDTILFIGNYENAIKNIISSFENDILDTNKSDDDAEKILSLMRYHKNFNLRLFIFACQKTVDIYEIIYSLDGIEIEQDFTKSIFYGIINFLMQIKDGELPDWEENNKIETNHVISAYRLYDYPLYRFCYDYIRWQHFNIDMAKETLVKYKKQRLFHRDYSYNNQDLNVIFKFYIFPENMIISALKNVEKRLSSFDDIPFYLYRELTYFLIRCNTILNFDYSLCKERMIQNVYKIRDEENETLIELFSNTHERFDFEDENELKRFVDFFNKITETLKSSPSSSNDEYKFSYFHKDLYVLFKKVRDNLQQIINNHAFISKFDFEKLVKMLFECSPFDLQTFRDMLFEVYKPTHIKAFLSADCVFMNKLKSDIESIIKKQVSSMDRIQLYQIKCLINDLAEFIVQFS